MKDLDAAISEAELVRARHGGVHAIHSYVSVLHFCRDFAELGDWPASVDTCFVETVANIRYVDRTGFPAHLVTEDGPRRDALDHAAFSD